MIKLSSIFVVAGLLAPLAVPVAEAQHRGHRDGRYERDRSGRWERGRDGRRDRDRRRHDRDRRHRSDYEYVEASCSPEVKQKNVAILERTVSEILATPQFAEATVLRAEVQRIQADARVDARIAGYVDLVGVDANDPREVAEFIGARDLAPYVETARERLSLNEAQADVLVRTLGDRLLNGLND